MVDTPEAATTDSPPPKSIRVGLTLVIAGVVLACLDVAAETAITLRLLLLLDNPPHATVGFGSYAIVAMRVLVYLGMVGITIVQCRRIRRRRNRARITLVVLLFVYVAGGVVNVAITWFELVLASLSSDRLESWPTDLAAASLIVDVILVVLAVTGAVLLLAGDAWTRPRVSQAAGTLDVAEHT